MMVRPAEVHDAGPVHEIAGGELVLGFSVEESGRSGGGVSRVSQRDCQCKAA